MTQQFKLEVGLGRYVILEPAEKSTILKAEEVSTVFKVISIGNMCEFLDVLENLLVIVLPNSVEKCMMGDKEVLYVRDTDIIGRVTEI